MDLKSDNIQIQVRTNTYIQLKYSFQLLIIYKIYRTIYFDLECCLMPAQWKWYQFKQESHPTLRVSKSISHSLHSHESPFCLDFIVSSRQSLEE